MTARTQSIHARLLSVATSRGEDFNLVLTRYALERWLYRLSVSDSAGDFVLKGALLFSLWFDKTSRPTRDADFLGLGASFLTLSVRRGPGPRDLRPRQGSLGRNARKR